MDNRIALHRLIFSLFWKSFKKNFTAEDHYFNFIFLESYRFDYFLFILRVGIIIIVKFVNLWLNRIVL